MNHPAFVLVVVVIVIAAKPCWRKDGHGADTEFVGNCVSNQCGSACNIPEMFLFLLLFQRHVPFVSVKAERPYCPSCDCVILSHGYVMLGRSKGGDPAGVAGVLHDDKQNDNADVTP